MNTKVGITAIIVAMFATMHLSQAVAQQKTVRACQEEWRANKAANQSAGITEKAYVAQCRGGAAAAQPTPPTGPAETTAAPPGAKTAKACREEWRANKADNQAKGITEKAYVEQCRTGAATAAPTPAAPPPTTAAPSIIPSQTGAGQKTVRACREEWRANKAENQAKGITEKAYVEQCRTGAATAAPTPAAPPPTSAAPAPATAPPAAPPPARSAAPTQPSPSQTAAPPPPAPAPTTTARPAPQPPPATIPLKQSFSTEAEAKAHCPADTVVWANFRSHIYHFSDTRYYGTTENGAYMCEKEAITEGIRAAKNETHP